MGQTTLALFLPRTVVVLGFVSLLNDAASEMITPLLPLFLTTTLGAGPVIVGLVEGVAEATASLLKLLSGWLVDRGWNPKGLVLGGYCLSNTARPFIGLAFGWSWILLLRFLDRVGKGLRTSPRDALIALSVPITLRGRAFGFHRGMDHAGAIFGPVAAFFLLEAGAAIEHVFLASLIPGILVLLLLLVGLPEKPAQSPQTLAPLRWQLLDLRLRALILASGGLALAHVPEVFLVLWVSTRGLETTWIPLLWAAAHVIKAIVAFGAGRLSDQMGRLPVIILGWSGRVAVLILIAVTPGGHAMTWALFLGYGAALAFTEGAERAFIGDFAPEVQKATAFGLYHLVTGLLMLPGALFFGALWEAWTPAIAFLMAAVLTFVSAFTLLVVTHK